MVKRSRRSSFMPDAYVFPGGRVDPEDAGIEVPGGEADRVRMGLGEAGAAYQVAAARECFEEARVRLVPGELVYWAHWITPRERPLRYDTRFFVAKVPPDQVAVHDGHETVDSAWWTVAEIFRRFEEGRIQLPPPTWRTLFELRDFRDVDAVLASGRTRPTPPIEPRAEIIDGRITVILPEGVPEPRTHVFDGERWFVHG
jgi:8-oxo-dGTP pyrophosphatase MutT (NUDIX family)